VLALRNRFGDRRDGAARRVWRREEHDYSRTYTVAVIVPVSFAESIAKPVTVSEPVSFTESIAFAESVAFAFAESVADAHTNSDIDFIRQAAAADTDE